MIRKVFRMFSGGIFIILSALIFGIAMITISRSEEILLNESRSAIHILLPAVFFFALAIMICFNRASKYLESKKTKLFLMGVILMIQGIFLIFISKIYPITDCYTTLDQAMAMLKEQNGVLDNTSDYFARYANNNFITIVFYMLFKVMSVFGLHNYYLGAILVNVFCIDISIILADRIVVNIYDERHGNRLLTLLTICPTTYLFLCFPYTNTYSMPFILGSVLCYIKYKKSKEHRYIWSGLCVSILVIGTFLRPTTIIMGMAIVIYEMVCGESIRNNIENKIKRIVYMISVVIIITFLLQSLIIIFLKDSTVDKSFPATHWVMVGLKGTGEVTRDDVRYTMSQSSKKEMISANLYEIKKRAKKLGAFGLAKLWIIKTGKIWSIGTDDYQVHQSSDREYSTLYKYIYGDKNGVVNIYTQVFRCVTFLFVLICAIEMFQKKETNYVYMLALALMGIILFLMLWETNKKHNLCYLPIAIILMEQGMEYASARWKSMREKKLKVGKVVTNERINLSLLVISVLMTGVSVVFMISDFSYFTKKQGEYRNYTFMKEDNDATGIKDIGEKQKRIEQTFSTEKKFNEVAVHFKVASKSDDSKYRVSLFGEKKEMILQKKVVAKELLSDDGWLTLKLDKTIHGEGKEYRISIVPMTNKRDSVSIVVYHALVFDQYTGGKAYVNGEVQKYDIAFRVCETVKEPYTTLLSYIMICIMIIIGQISVVVYLSRVYMNNKSFRISR